MSDDIRDLEENEELDDEDEVEGHRFAMNDEPDDDDFEAHIKLD